MYDRLDMEDVIRITDLAPSSDCGGTAVYFKRPVGGHTLICSVCDYEPPVVKYELVSVLEEWDTRTESVVRYNNLSTLIAGFNDLNFPPEVSILKMRLVRGKDTRVLSYKERANVFWINPKWTDGFDVRQF